MAKATSVIIRMQSSESDYSYVTKRNRGGNKPKLSLKKYDPIVRRHVIFTEKKL